MTGNAAHGLFEERLFADQREERLWHRPATERPKPRAATATPDGKTMFINVQHPGEPASELSDPKNPRAISNWPDKKATGRPRSATVVIRKADGGIIGT
jgi:hypothetical protein